jgi:hypothetical protein
VNFLFGKKGAIELQFNWIFTLVVGGLIIVMIIFFINNQVKSAEFESHVSLQEKLDTVMQNARQSDDSLFSINVDDVSIRAFESCSDGFYMNDDKNLRLSTDLVFSPKLLETDTNMMVLWSVPWEMPYKVTNFMYMTVPDVRYVFVNGTDIATVKYLKGIYSDRNQISFPNNITKEMITPGVGAGINLMNKNNYKIRFVVMNQEGGCGPYTVNMGTVPADSDVSLVCIEVDSRTGGLDGYGKVYYFRENTPGNFLKNDAGYFLGRASLIGAIFAEDEGQFKCIMGMAYTRLNRVTEIYKYRTGALDTYYSTQTDSYCYQSAIYYNSKDSLDEIIKSIPPPLNEPYIYEKAVSSPQSVKNMNLLAQQRSCPTIY